MVARVIWRRARRGVRHQGCAEVSCEGFGKGLFCLKRRVRRQPGLRAHQEELARHGPPFPQVRVVVVARVQRAEHMLEMRIVHPRVLRCLVPEVVLPARELRATPENDDEHDRDADHVHHEHHITAHRHLGPELVVPIALDARRRLRNHPRDAILAVGARERHHRLLSHWDVEDDEHHAVQRGERAHQGDDLLARARGRQLVEDSREQHVARQSDRVADAHRLLLFLLRHPQPRR